MTKFSKKIFTAFLTCVLTFTSIPFITVKADENNTQPTEINTFDSGNLRWREFSDNTATITAVPETNGFISRDNLTDEIQEYTGQITVQDGIVFPFNSDGLFLMFKARALILKNSTAHVTNMTEMFSGMMYATTLDLGPKFDTSKVNTMDGMFRDMTALTNLDLGNQFNTVNVSKMDTMFYNMTSLETLNLGESFDTQNVLTMSNMFSRVTSLKKLDLGEKFDTSKVMAFTGMLAQMPSLEVLDLGPKFNTKLIDNKSNFFSGPYKLKEITLSENVEFIPAMYQNASLTSDSEETGVWVEKSDGRITFTSFLNLLEFYNGAYPGTYLRRNGSSLNVRFMLDSGEFVVHVWHGELVNGIMIPNPVKMGFIFTGWSTEAFSKVPNIDLRKAPILETMNLYPVFVDKRVIVDFHANGWEGVKPIQTIVDESGFNLPSQGNLSRRGHSFSGWNTQKDGTGDLLMPGIHYKPLETTTLYAQWTPNTYSISYDLNGGSIEPSVNPSSYVYGVGIPVFSTPTKQGYSFTGWIDQFNRHLSGVPTTFDTDLNLVAEYTKNPFTLTFDFNGIPGHIPSTLPVHGGGNVTIPDSYGTVLQGHSFVSWNTQSDGLGTSYKKNDAFTMPEGNVTLYAQWTPNVYTISYNLDGGTLSGVAPETYTYGEGVSSFETPFKVGHSFLGWNDSSNNPITEISKTSHEDVSLKALWKTNSYSVGFYVDGKLLKEISVNYNELISNSDLPEIPEKEGYNIIGWQIESLSLRAIIRQLFDVTRDTITFDTRLSAVYELKQTPDPVDPVTPVEPMKPTDPTTPNDVSENNETLPEAGVSDVIQTFGVSFVLVGLALLIRKRLINN